MANYTSVFDLPHVALIEPIGDPVFMWRITMEDGYWIHQPVFGENVWKTVTGIYPNEDLSTTEIRATADLPENAELCGGDNDHEVM